MESQDNSRYIRINKGGQVNVLMGVSSLAKSYERAVICIREGDNIYKIISVSSSKNDGSINVFFPYCKEKQSYIFRHRHKYTGGKQKIKRSKITREFIVDKNTKLSIHRSGFVQLSGRGILSGIDKKTGEPRGIGVFSRPLGSPVNSGPTFIFHCWGLEKGFELLSRRDKSIQYIVLDKDRNDFTERIWRKNKKINTYLLEFFIFPKEANQGIYEYRGEPFIDHTIHNYLFNPGATFTHPVLDLKYFDGVICVFPVLSRPGYTGESETGYGLGGPGGSHRLNDKSGIIYTFHLICPRGSSGINSEIKTLGL